MYQNKDAPESKGSIVVNIFLRKPRNFRLTSPPHV